MSCIETIQAYGLRSLGIGERLLPKSDFTLCEQVVLIGSGMIWNVYFAAWRCHRFWFAMALAVGKNGAQTRLSGYRRQASSSCSAAPPSSSIFSPSPTSCS
ncbi:MAG: hypothetical protein CM15mP115_21660 [Alphaproteobacteria bacterium]|nr:MAG: hypothetical protein CM15mP115_21660 [Alphaproteobacteria bacterium]